MCFPLENPRHERFAQAVAMGRTLQDAYREAGYAARNPKKELWRLGRNPLVRQRVQYLLVQESRRSLMTRDELTGWLASIIRATPDDMRAPDSRFELNADKNGPRVVLPSKLAAAAQLVKLCGWDQPAPHRDESEDTLDHFLENMRDRLSLSATPKASLPQGPVNQEIPAGVE